MSIAKTYLLLYNLSMFLGWSYLMVMMSPLLLYFESSRLYLRIESILKIVQTGAVLEILHASAGLVKSNPILTGCQVFSRVFVVWAILHGFTESQRSIGLPLLLVAWTVTEMIRYPFYAVALTRLKELSLLTRLRYTLFIGLYPLGVTGELLCMYSTLEPVSTTSTYSIKMPNPYNFTFSFYYFIIAVMLLYIPIFPRLYGHMLHQRKKVLFETLKKET